MKQLLNIKISEKDLKELFKRNKDLKHNTINDFILKKKSSSYKDYFLFRISIDAYNQLKECGIKEVNN